MSSWVWGAIGFVCGGFVGMLLMALLTAAEGEEAENAEAD